jgi:hypothetical protein
MNPQGRVREDKVRSPSLLNVVATSKEDEAHSKGTDVGEDGDEPLGEGEEALAIVNALVWL